MRYRRDARDVRPDLVCLPAYLCKKSFILIDNAIPIIVSLHSNLGPVAITLDQRAVSQDALELLRKIKLVLIRYSSVPYGFDVLRSRQSQHTVAIAHGFQKGRMGSSHFGGMHVTIGVLLQRTVVLAKNETCKNYALVATGAIFKVGDVVMRVGSIADD